MKLDPLKLLLVTGLGSGLLPGAPGTWGSAVAAALWLLAAFAFGQAHGYPLIALTSGGVLAAGILCVALGPWAIRRSGRVDPRFVVIDEFAGQWFALLIAAWAFPRLTSTTPIDWPILITITAASQFLLFRLFDITKPFPCRLLERLPRGWGILADDLMAGVYAGLAGQLLLIAMTLLPHLRSQAG